MVMHCTLFTISDENTTWVGFNFDWISGGGKIWFIPPAPGRYGYCITTRFGKRFPYEGMNQRGLYIGQTAVPTVKTKFDRSKKISLSTGVFNDVLQNCATVDEAITLLSGHSILFGTLLGFVMFHILVADVSGASAIIEFIGDRAVVHPRKGPLQVMTNFYLADPDLSWPRPVAGCGGYDRYETAKLALADLKHASTESLFAILKSASVTDWEYDRHVYNTLFSNVYNLNTRDLYLVYRKNFSKTGHFSLDDELTRGMHYYRFE
jgi:hypothetical protein